MRKRSSPGKTATADGFLARYPEDVRAPFDWRMLGGVKNEVAFVLSGGLTPDNVAEAIRLTGATAVDVSSGVESRPGEKDPELIRRFLRAAKGV